MILLLHNTSNKEVGICHDNQCDFLAPMATVEIPLQSAEISFFINEPSYIKRDTTNFKFIKNVELFDGYYFIVESLFRVNSIHEVTELELFYHENSENDIFAGKKETYAAILPQVKRGECWLLSLRIKDKEVIYPSVREEEKRKIEIDKKNKEAAKKFNIDKIYRNVLICSASFPFILFFWFRLHGEVKTSFLILFLILFFMFFAGLVILGDKGFDCLVKILNRNKKKDQPQATKIVAESKENSRLDKAVETLFDEKHIRSVLWKTSK